jgi:hypothetical protein
MSSATVSDANTKPDPMRPAKSGFIPFGSLAAKRVPSSISPTIE